jgi:transcriptional regulator with XRE-family HTH domain
MDYPKTLENIPTLDIRSLAGSRPDSCVVALLTSDNDIMWENEYLRTGLPEGTTVRCRIIENDSYNNSGADWIDIQGDLDDDEQVFNFYGLEGEDWLDNIKRRALAIIDKPAWRYLHYDERESGENDPDERPSSDGDENDEEHEAEELLSSARPSVRRKADFTNVDWSLSNTELAEQLGVTASAVYYQRKQRCPETVIGKYRKVDFTKVDWSLSNKAIAEQFCATAAYIAFQRKIKSPYTVTKSIRKVDYTQVDWSLSDKEIALKFETTRKNIRRQRRLRAQKQCVGEENEDKYADVDWSLSDIEIARQFGVWPTTIYNQRIRRNLNKKKHRIDYLQIDWSRSDDELSKYTGFSQKTIKHYRKKYCLEQFTNETKELPCKELQGKFLPRNRSKARFARRQATVSRLNAMESAPAYTLQSTRACRRKDNSEKSAGSDRYVDIDWTQTNLTLARQLGVSPTTITYWRRKNAKLKISIDKYIDIDWSNTNVELAQSLGVTVKTIVKQRKKYNIVPACGTIKKIDYSNVDWGQSNKILAQQLEVSTVTISFHRRLRSYNAEDGGVTPPLAQTWSSSVGDLQGLRP